MSVTPVPGTNLSVATGGTAVSVVNALPNGGIITNPLSAGDQGLGLAEPLYVNPLGTATLNGNGSTFALQPGQSWQVIPEQSTTTTVNAASSGHKFSAVQW